MGLFGRCCSTWLSLYFQSTGLFLTLCWLYTNAIWTCLNAHVCGCCKTPCDKFTTYCRTLIQFLASLKPVQVGKCSKKFVPCAVHEKGWKLVAINNICTVAQVKSSGFLLKVFLLYPCHTLCSGK